MFFAWFRLKKRHGSRFQFFLWSRLGEKRCMDLGFCFFLIDLNEKNGKIFFFWIISRGKMRHGSKFKWFWFRWQNYMDLCFGFYVFYGFCFFLVRVHFFSGWCTWEKNKAWMLASDLFGFDILFWVWPKREKRHGSWFHFFRLDLNERKHLGLVSRLPFSQSADWFCFANYMFFETQSNLVGFYHFNLRWRIRWAVSSC